MHCVIIAVAVLYYCVTIDMSGQIITVVVGMCISTAVTSTP